MGRMFWDGFAPVDATRAVDRVGLSERMQGAAMGEWTLSDGATTGRSRAHEHARRWRRASHYASSSSDDPVVRVTRRVAGGFYREDRGDARSCGDTQAVE
jgi:hypothetical protein